MPRNAKNVSIIISLEFDAGIYLRLIAI